jgi:hypothetical protein
MNQDDRGVIEQILPVDLEIHRGGEPVALTPEA